MTTVRPRAEGWKTVRVFISSTFLDMQAERDYLVRFVFPRMREELITKLRTSHNSFETQCGSWAAFKLTKYLAIEPELHRLLQKHIDAL